MALGKPEALLTEGIQLLPNAGTQLGFKIDDRVRVMFNPPSITDRPLGPFGIG